MLFFFACLIAIYLLISVMIAGHAQVLGEFVISMGVLLAAMWLIFHYFVP